MMLDVDDIMDEIEAEEREDSFFEWLNEGVDDIDIGTCACGAYGYLGKIHVAMFDGRMEECGEYL